MSAIAHYLEDEGIATTGISLVRENTASFKPPRFLWVSFPLGRPLGVPGDASFQHRVIAASLDLLMQPGGPVLLDYAEDAPADGDYQPFVCPVSFGRESVDLSSWPGKLTAEVASLAPWYEKSVLSRGQTTVGITGVEPAVLARTIGELLEQQASVPADIKHHLEDLKAYYLEAMAAQPGTQTRQLATWIWYQTVLGEAMQQLRNLMLDSDDEPSRLRAEAIVPRWVLLGTDAPAASSGSADAQ